MEEQFLVNLYNALNKLLNMTIVFDSLDRKNNALNGVQ